MEFDDTLEEKDEPGWRKRFPFECDVCGEVFESREDAESHVTQDHPDVSVAAAISENRESLD
jgi:hypothetical protein